MGTMVGVNTKRMWEERSRRYGTKIEGVLPKSLPRVLNQYLHDWMYNQVRLFIDKSKEYHVLDLGCGYGRLSDALLREFPHCRTFGVDVSATYVRLYNKALSPRGRAITTDTKSLPFKSSSFDLVFMVTTLMYVVEKKDQKISLRELFRVLKPGGHFVIIERNPIGQNIVVLGGLAEKIRGESKKEIPAVSFPYKYMKKLIEENGGLIEEAKGIPAWTLTIHAAIVLSFISDRLARNFMRIISFLDQKLDFLLTPSLYIAYSGKKR